MHSRLEKIETKLALAEDLLDEINKTLFRQDKRLEQLEAALSAMRERVESLTPPEPRDPAAEVPPHY